MLTQERVKELLDYYPATGVFVWKVNKNRAKAGSTAGSPYSTGYVYIQIDGKKYKAHRLAWLYVYGCWPDKEIDHINRNRSDNRLGNLRDTDKNSWNTGDYKNNTSGYQGVSWHKHAKKWLAQIKVYGKQKHLGLFDTIEAANAAYIAAKEEHHTL